MFFFGKPVIIYERSGYPSKIFHYGKDLLASSRSEVYSKFKMLINDLAAYNKNLDKDRKRLFFPRDNSKFKEKLERILNKN